MNRCIELEELSDVSKETVQELVDKFYKYLNNQEKEVNPTSVSSLTSLDKESLIAKSDAKSSEKSQGTTHSKGNAPPSYTNLLLQNAPRQSERHNTVSYPPTQTEKSSYAQKYSRPVLMKSQSTNCENRSTGTGSS